ncbi:MAG TPA: hypothetical protein VK116_17665, partial [Planctomycetota bacterium]|nr:hypothetical protein [Planctomycetota bacterium]
MLKLPSRRRGAATAILFALVLASVALLVPGAQPTLALPQRRSEALDSLQRALQSKSPKALDEALVEVIREGGASHVKRLVDLAQRI